MNAVDELNALLGIGPPKPRLPITLQRSGYEAIKVLGKGSFGQAYLIFHKATKKYYVAKHVNLAKMDQKQRKEARNEIAILQRMKHPNVVKYEESVEQGADLYIVMEYADGGDLYSHINKVKASGAMMTEDQVINLFTQVAMAIKYMHDRKVIHRDIKPQNVFLTKARVVKIGDFGISTVLNHTMAMATTLCGTPCYFSPELCDSRPYNNKSDVWALGVLLYEMASLELPFDSPNMKRLMDDIRRVQPVRKKAFSEGVWNLIQMMLIKDPFKRPDIDGVLAHPTIVKALPRIASLLAAGEGSAAPSISIPLSGGPSRGLGGDVGFGDDENSREDEAMLAMWKAKRDREAAAKANNNNNNIIPTPPAAPPIATPAARAGVALPQVVQQQPIPSAPAKAVVGGGAAALAVGAGMSAAALERAKRDEEYRKLREEMAKIEENRRVRMDRERQQEAIVDEYLKRREEQQRKITAAEMAEAELKRAEALRMLREKEAREQQEAAAARARDLAAMESKAQAAKEAAMRARMETERQAAILAEREAREKSEMAQRKLAAERALQEDQQKRGGGGAAAAEVMVMMADEPSFTSNNNNKNDRANNNAPLDDIEDETEGLTAVIRNMQSIHERSIGHIAPEDIEDEVGHVQPNANRKPLAATPTKQSTRHHLEASDLNQTIVDEVGDAAAPAVVSNHTFEDPMGTCVNVEEIRSAVTPAKRLASRGGGGTTASDLHHRGEDDNRKESGGVDDDEDDDEPIQGQCLCGKVEFVGYLSYIYGSFTCTCNVCRRFSGSVSGVSWLHLPAVLFPEVVKPSESLRNFELGGDGLSRCYFCRTCGSSIAMEHPGVDGCVISKASLDKKSTEALMKNQRTAR